MTELSPQAFKPPTGDTGVAHGHCGIAVAQVILHGPKIGSLIGKGITTRMPKHVGMNVANSCLVACSSDQIVDGVPAQRREPATATAAWIRAMIPFRGVKL